MYFLSWFLLALVEVVFLDGKSVSLKKRTSNHVANTIQTNKIDTKTLNKDKTILKKSLSNLISKKSENIVLGNTIKSKLDDRASLKEKAFNTLFVGKRPQKDGSKKHLHDARKHSLKNTPTSFDVKLQQISEKASVRNATQLKKDTHTYLRNVTQTSTNDTLEKRECCHYWDHGHDLMELHNNPHHWGSDFMHGPAHDEFHSIDEHGERLDLGEQL